MPEQLKLNARPVLGSMNGSTTAETSGRHVPMAVQKPCVAISSSERFIRASTWGHGEIEASDHPAAKIHRQCQPRPPERSTILFVNNEDICLGVVNLDDLQRSRNFELARNGNRRLLNLRLAARLGWLGKINVFDACDNRFPMGRRQPCRATACVHLTHESRYGWAVLLQIETLDLGPDDFVARCVEDPVADRAAGLASHE